MANYMVYRVNCMQGGKKFSLAIQAKTEGDYQRELNNFVSSESGIVVLDREIMTPAEYSRYKSGY